MGQQQITDTQAGFLGGLNITSDPAFLRPDQARQLKELRLTTYGAALKRLGTVLTSAAPITTMDATNNAVGGIYWPLQAQAYVFAAGTNTTAMHVYRSAYALSAPTTWSDLGAIPQWRPVIFNDGTNESMYVAGDNTKPVQKIHSDGVTISPLGTATSNVSGLVVYNDRLWGWSANQLYYSNLSSAVGSTGGDSLGDVANGGGSIVIRTFGVVNIACCKVVNGILEIHHTIGISTLTGWGQDDIAVAPQPLNSVLGPGWGTIQGGTDVADSVVVVNEDSSGDIAYFVTTLGVFSSNGSSIKPLGTPDKPDPIAALILAGTIVMDELSITFNRRSNEVWVFVRTPIQGLYVYNVILESWSGPFAGNYASNRGPAFFNMLDSLGNAWLWRVDTTGGNTNVIESDSLLGSAFTPVYKDTVTPNGTTTGSGGVAITSVLQMRRCFGQEVFGVASSRMFSKSWRWINLLATFTSGATPPVIASSTQLGGTNTQTLSAISSIEQNYYISPGGVGPYVDVTITDAGASGVSQYAMATVQGNVLGQR